MVVLNVFDKMVEAVCSVPRVETKLYPSDSVYASKPNLHPVIDEKLLQEAKEQVGGMEGGKEGERKGGRDPEGERKGGMEGGRGKGDEKVLISSRCNWVGLE